MTWKVGVIVTWPGSDMESMQFGEVPDRTKAHERLSHAIKHYWERAAEAYEHTPDLADSWWQPAATALERLKDEQVKQWETTVVEWHTTIELWAEEQ